MFRFSSEDREYNKYRIYSNETGESIEKEFHPNEIKMFNFDIFNMNEGNIKIVNSPSRIGTISCVLVLDNQLTYGKHKDKFLYKCVPDDCRIPVFLVPFKIKIGFNKKLENRYVVIKFIHWKDKHPFGQIEHNIGCVSDLSSFYQYQLYCKSLYASIQRFNTDTRKKLKQYKDDEIIKNIILQYNVEDRLNHKIISIDPKESKDFDDAFGYELGEVNSTISIYIANVPLWLDYLDLWDSFSKRIATIYLPDRKVPMLPTILSDDLCSLKENVDRFAIALDVVFNNKTGKIISTNFKNTIINVYKNLRYDTKNQERDTLYKQLCRASKIINKTSKYSESLRSSHDVVACFMILMNNICANKLYESKKGIFRNMSLTHNGDESKIDDSEIKRFLTIWNGNGSNYCKWDVASSHDMLRLDRYLHITSPIRRLVDLLNIIMIQNIEDITSFTNGAEKFYNKWTTDENIKMINETMRSIRKVQNKCSLLHLCTNNPDMLLSSYEGFIFDKIIRSDNLFQYQIYFKTIKVSQKLITSIDIPIHVFRKFKIHYFMDESRLYKKLRISIVE